MSVNMTTRFMNSKMLTFAEMSLASFVYNVVDIFIFPDDVTQDIYSQNWIIHVCSICC